MYNQGCVEAYEYSSRSVVNTLSRGKEYFAINRSVCTFSGHVFFIWTINLAQIRSISSK